MKLRGAIVGLGTIALRAHLPGWRDRRDVEIVAVTDAYPARRGAAGTLLPGARWYESAAELMAGEDLHFVDICTPPSSHAGLIRAALDRGLHVLCEKPLVCSLADLAAVGRHASASGRVLHTVHNWHHAPIIRRTRALLRDGAIGRIKRVVWQTLRTRPAAIAEAGGQNWRVDPVVAGGGVLTDHGWHVFYLLRRWMGGGPTSISATLEQRRFTELAVEDTATLRLTFPGATAEVLLTWASDARRTWAELTGTEGSIRLEDGTLVVSRRGREHPEQRWPCPPALSDGSYHPEWFGRVADSFMAAVKGSRRRAENLAEASLCVTLEALARESSRRGGQPLPLSPAPLPVPMSTAGLST
ncbi:MAG: Gfo/Idh/MocA family oxidoreductase [Candidatus Rokubacteria bacterium]|nr:Gfo/Idh/MocA family oxidoreductase [Candidatus Rokubacteria bacterium]